MINRLDLNSEEVRQVVLERVMFKLNQEVTDLVRNSEFTLFEFKTELGPRMVVELNSYALGERVWEACYYYPSNWWQAFKERWFPSWLTCRKTPYSLTFKGNFWLARKVHKWLYHLYWPVKKEVVKFEIDRIYPWLAHSLPKERSRLVFRSYSWGRT